MNQLSSSFPLAKIITFGLILSCIHALSGCEKSSQEQIIPNHDSLSSNNNAPQITATISNLLVQNPSFFTSLNNGEQVFIAGSDGTIIHTDNNSLTTKNPQWQAAKTHASDNILSIAASPNGSQLVAVGENGLILYSPDRGINWQIKTSNTTKKLTTIAFDSSHSTWIAGGEDGVVLQSQASSTDSWTSINANNGINLSKIYYLTESKNVIAIGENGLLMLSNNGGNEWKKITLPTTAALTRLVTIDHVTIISCADGNILRSENNFEDWEIISTGSSSYLTDLILDPLHNTLLTISANGEVILSDDGGTLWAPVSNTHEYLNDIISVDAAKKLLIAGANGTQLQSDNGGRTWETTSPLTSSSIDGLMAIDARRIIAYGEGGLLIQSNDAGDSWAIVRAPINDFVHQLLKVTNNNWLAVGAKGLLLTSGDQGQDWQPIISTQQTNDYFFSIIDDKKSGALITAGPPGSILVSTDLGQTWRVRLALGDANQGYFHQLLSDDQRTIVALAGPGTAHYSTDAGETWSISQSDNSKHLFAGTYDEAHQQFVAVGQTGAIQISRNGKTWQVIDAGTNQNLQTVYAIKGKLWIGGEQGLILHSDDAGLTWTSQISGTTHTILTISHLRSNTLLATGNNGLILRLTSQDNQWQLISNPANDMLRKPVQDPTTGIIYIASRSGTILYSKDDGQHWATMEPFTQASIKTLAIDVESKTLLGGGERLIRIPLLTQD